MPFRIFGRWLENSQLVVAMLLGLDISHLCGSLIHQTNAMLLSIIGFAFLAGGISIVVFSGLVVLFVTVRKKRIVKRNELTISFQAFVSLIGMTIAILLVIIHTIRDYFVPVGQYAGYIGIYVATLYFLLWLFALTIGQKWPTITI